MTTTCLSGGEKGGGRKDYNGNKKERIRIVATWTDIWEAAVLEASEVRVKRKSHLSHLLQSVV